MQNTNTTNNAGIIVSFCIPVYNNAKAAQIMVEYLLRSDDSRFEVVVSDDNSRENVGELLSGIHDSRLRYFRNENNLGAHKNWEHALELGRGEWLYLIMARDMVHGENITRLIEFLEHARKNGITYLKDGYAWLMGNRVAKKYGIAVYEGIKAMTKCIRIEHPSGDIYDGEMFRTIPDRTRYFEISDMYPENYVRHYMLLRGKGAYIMSGLYFYYDPRLIEFSEVRSGTDKSKNVFDSYFAPARCIKQHLELIDMIDGDCPRIFALAEADRYLASAIMELLYNITLRWRNRCDDESWMFHYGHSTRHVSIREMLTNVLTARRTVESHLRDKGTLTLKRRVIICVCGIVATMRYIVYHTAKRGAKKILEPLGIWPFFKFLKRLIKGNPLATKA